ncbi:MAG: formate dehydrogenase subunit alpha [Armatimonadetes bacterium]|nr:formate dehydrogenase subunit alpha [Armatimonadota bacterium]
MATISIDGTRVEATENRTVLQAALDAGIYIPHLCHHPDLKPVGMCRLCVVELEGRGIVASCEAAAQDGMKVLTDTPQVQKVRQVALELLLTNHDSNCLACAKNNDCGLQKVAAFIGVDEARFKQLRMLTPQYAIDDSNPFFRRDPNKCVLCGICVRTCAEIQGSAAIDYAFRGFATAISTLGNKPIAESKCQSCGECVVRCPTGALAPKETRKPSKEVLTTCTFCGVGCQLYLGARGGEIVSARGDRESPVNRGHLCVKGRFGYSFINSPERLKTPLIKKDGKFVAATWDEALDLITRKFAEYKGDQFAVMGSSRCTNEDNYVLMKFTRAVMGTNNVDNCARLCHAPTVTGLGASFGAGGGTNTIAEIPGADCLFIIGCNPTHAHPVVGMRIRAAVGNGAKLIVADPRRIELGDNATLSMTQKPGTDVALLMGMARVIYSEGLHNPQFIEERCDGFKEFVKAMEPFTLDFVEETTGVPREQVVEAARLYAKSDRALILWALGITEHSHGTDNVMALANLAMLTGNIGRPSCGAMPLRGQNNVQGACDLGVIPNAFHGYQKIADPAAIEKFEKAWDCKLSTSPGLGMVEQLQQTLTGKIKAYYLVGIDPAYSVSDANQVWEALRQAEFVVAQDIFLSGTAEFADVVLPATSFAEKDGTFTNLERRLQRIRKVIEPPGEAKADWWITCEIARRMGGKGFDYNDPSEILDEMGRLSSWFTGINFERLDAGGIQWPCPSTDHPGTPILHTERFATANGKGQLAPLVYRPPVDSADAEYPIILTTGRSLYHFHLAMTSKVPGLMALHPEELVWMHPKDARRLGIADGDKVKVSSEQGEVDVRAKVTKDMRPGTAYMTFHFYETPTNVLTHQKSLDPVSKTPEYKVTAIRIERV